MLELRLETQAREKEELLEQHQQQIEAKEDPQRDRLPQNSRTAVIWLPRQPENKHQQNKDARHGLHPDKQRLPTAR